MACGSGTQLVGPGIGGWTYGLAPWRHGEITGGLEDWFPLTKSFPFLQGAKFYHFFGEFIELNGRFSIAMLY